MSPGRVMTVLLIPLAMARGLAGQERSGPTAAGVDSLIRVMTLDEKLAMLHGAPDPAGTAGAGYLPGVPRLGIPPLRLADGPAGIRTTRPATALPAPVMLSATFDPALAHAFGTVIGREGRARDQDVLLSPMVNIVRVPHAGRNFETLGEDPLLAARIVAEEIRGIQEQGLIATVKHYAANNFEQGRANVDVVVDERTLHEIYLPGFAAAVGADVGAVMCAYNRLNGAHACDHPHLLNDILRGELGFAGWVMTDWFARHSLAALTAGLDQEMPGLSIGPSQPVYFGDSLRAAVSAGRIPEAVVDRAVRRILVRLDRAGLLGTPPPRPAFDATAGRATARDVALAGAVLLRNEHGTLPLTARDRSALVMIGPTASTLLYGGGGSSQVTPTRTESPLDALRRRAGAAANVRHVAGIDLDGVPIPPSALRPPAGSTGRGLLRTARDGSGRIDSVVDYTGAGALPATSSWRWTGSLTAPVTGTYEIKLQSRGNGAKLSLDGRPVLSTAGFFSDASLLRTADDLWNATVTLSLVAGEAHVVELTTAPEGTGLVFGPIDEPLQLRLSWVTPARQQAFLDEAVAAARAANAVIVFAYDEGTEGRDRPSLALPDAQEALVAAVAAVNPRTTVVLNTGDPVLMPWLAATGAVLQLWYPGQEGGDATAALLLGEANPGGKLPVTFPAREDATPVAAARARYPGMDGRARYDEGILVGYRWYDAHDVEPLFAFGHGLSYTSFSYSDLRIAPDGQGLVAAFRVRNTGDRAGTEVAQVYVGPPEDPPVLMEPRRLVGFARVTLAPGEERLVTVAVRRRALAFWSTGRNGWVVPTGRRPVYVGSSSRDVRLRGETPAVPDAGGSSGAAPAGYELVWADEFARSGLPDSSRWAYDVGDGCPRLCGWGNQELQHYTAGVLANARVEDGHLVIEARRETVGTRGYTSARLVTRGTADWTYGRFEIRARLPSGRGTWPAIWMLPTGNVYGGWPASGEIDIMEHVGFAPDSIHGSVHTAAYNHVKRTQSTSRHVVPDAEQAFHVYAVEWTPERIDFYVDETRYHSFANEGTGPDVWPFDRPFHLVLNLAVGGGWGGMRGVDDTIWPQRMVVDYVRVYQHR